ncbi:Sec-independent protein translocase protein TatB [Sphingomonas sp. gentR]|jgi:sec-independent protein translocase protein TatB|uniref:Sec-independent protein translocase protein TatB n=1 Tax=unclassified Sphingomonas TaxID=196159 RepID=UPI000972B41C|nr:Sec-independent protein translocase protein TatB [Sphingomonas sp. LK11]APX66810.1 preprotein translocase subunit TatB [Sphingomonas sp. LK11]
MFNIDSSEFLLVAIVALVVIGPKDLPKAMRVVGYWVGKARGVTRQFRQGFDNMVREAELEEMEKRWAAENERIMREHAADTPPHVDAEATSSATSPAAALPDHTAPGHTAPDATHGDAHADHSDRPVMVEKPVVAPAPASEHPSRGTEGAAS